MTNDGLTIANSDATIEVSDKKDDSKIAERSKMEESILRNALSFMKSSDAKWVDARGQSGPSPADFGEHEPIPVDAICASVVMSETEES